MSVLMLLVLAVIVAATATMITLAVVGSQARRRPPLPGPPQSYPPPSLQAQPYNPTNYLSPGDRERIMMLIRRGKKIHAIKLYREVTGAGLKEAKDACDYLERYR